MTDDDIIKALEIHTNEESECSSCPYKEPLPRDEEGVISDCIAMLIIDAFDLIKRQRAEIEKLEKGSLKEAMTFNLKTIANIKTEAIKEFAERLKMEADGYDFCGDGIVYQMVGIEDVDNLVKEMVGDDNDG